MLEPLEPIIIQVQTIVPDNREVICVGMYELGAAVAGVVTALVYMQKRIDGIADRYIGSLESRVNSKEKAG